MPACEHTEYPSAAVPLLLVEELSHRVVNEYAQAVATIYRSARNVKSMEARQVLLSAAGRLCDYAAAHRALQIPVDAKIIDLSAYLERLCGALSVATLKERGVRLSLVAEKLPLNAERSWRVALIVAELINNAVRHGVPDGGGAILVKLEQFGENAACQVIDNGGVDHQPVASRGLSVVRRLASELGGDVRWIFGHEGTRVEVVFPMSIKE